MLIKRPADIPSSEITDKKVYLNRREFIQAASGTALATAAGALGTEQLLAAQQPAAHGRKLETKKSPLSTTEAPNSWDHITTYNNFYEFGTDKNEPAIYSKKFVPEPWTVTVDGECNKKGKLNLEDILKGVTLEDRIYRHRCVEAWSMVIPWVGFSLADFINKCEPTSKANFIQFTTLFDPRRMPFQQQPILQWPYVEGLRMDEAKHPLTILVVGLSRRGPAQSKRCTPTAGHSLGVRVQGRQVDREGQLCGKAAAEHLAANGPARIRLYANVNPEVDHPRWSQATERRLPSLFKNTKTQPFNGYGDQVASMYSGLDLRKNF